MPRHRTDFAVQQEQTPNDLHQEETLYTVGEVAKRLRVDTTTVRRWISIGVLDAVILPHRGKRQAYRIRERTLDKLLQPSSPSGSSTESSIRLCLPSFSQLIERAAVHFCPDVLNENSRNVSVLLSTMGSPAFSMKALAYLISWQR